MAKTKVAARISGIALAPGVSANNRSYSRQAIARMVARAQDRISSGTLPLVMKTSHEESDASKVVGRLTSIKVNEQGAAQFTGEIAATKTGRDVAKLVKGGFLRGVSIRGQWVGKTRSERGPAGQTVEAGDDLELFGLDWTPSPGVVGAQVTAAESAPAGQVRESVPVVAAGSQRAALLEQAQRAYDARLEELARSTLDQLIEQGLPETWASSSAPRTSSPVSESKGSKSAPQPAVDGPTAADLARMPEDEFATLAAEWGVRHVDAARGTYRPMSALSARDLD